MTVSLRYGIWFIVCERGKHGKYIAYGSLEKLPANPAIGHSKAAIYFQFGETQEKAIARLKSELDRVK